MGYNIDDLRRFSKEYIEIFNLCINSKNTFPNVTVLYIRGDIEKLNNYLKIAKNLPKEFYREHKFLKDNIKESISILEEAIKYCEDDIKANKREYSIYRKNHRYTPRKM